MKKLVLIFILICVGKMGANAVPWEYIPAQDTIFSSYGRLSIDSSGQIISYNESGFDIYKQGSYSHIDSIKIENPNMNLLNFHRLDKNKIVVFKDRLMQVRRGVGFVEYKNDKWTLINNKLMGLETNHIHGLAKCKDGTFWFAHDNNIVHFDGSNYKEYKHEDSSKFVLATHCMECIDNELWYVPGFKKSLVRFSSKSDYTEFPLDTAINNLYPWDLKLFKTWDEEMLVCYPNGYVEIWKDKKIIKKIDFKKDNLLDIALPPEFNSHIYVQEFVKDHAGNYWFIFSPHKNKDFYQYLVRMDAKGGWKYILLPEQNYAPHTLRCGGMSLAPDGKIWFSTTKPKIGLYSFDPRKSSVDGKVESVHDVYTSNVVPNPVSNVSKVKFYCPADKYSSLEATLYDIMGREIKKFDKSTFNYSTSTYIGSFIISNSDFKHGVYYLNLRIGGSTKTTGVIIE